MRIIEIILALCLIYTCIAQVQIYAFNLPWFSDRHQKGYRDEEVVTATVNVQFLSHTILVAAAVLKKRHTIVIKKNLGVTLIAEDLRIRTKPLQPFVYINKATNEICFDIEQFSGSLLFKSSSIALHTIMEKIMFAASPLALEKTKRSEHPNGFSILKTNGMRLTGVFAFNPSHSTLKIKVKKLQIKSFEGKDVVTDRFRTSMFALVLERLFSKHLFGHFLHKFMHRIWLGGEKYINSLIHQKHLVKMTTVPEFDSRPVRLPPLLPKLSDDALILTSNTLYSTSAEIAKYESQRLYDWKHQTYAKYKGKPTRQYPFLELSLSDSVLTRLGPLINTMLQNLESRTYTFTENSRINWFTIDRLRVSEEMKPYIDRRTASIHVTMNTTFQFSLNVMKFKTSPINMVNVSFTAGIAVIPTAPLTKSLGPIDATTGFFICDEERLSVSNGPSFKLKVVNLEIEHYRFGYSVLSMSSIVTMLLRMTKKHLVLRLDDVLELLLQNFDAGIAKLENMINSGLDLGNGKLILQRPLCGITHKSRLLIGMPGFCIHRG